jgi:hypothetical protein
MRSSQIIEKYGASLNESAVARINARAVFLPLESNLALIGVQPNRCAGGCGAPIAAQPKPQPQPQTVRCIKDSFGNYTCTDGTRVIHDSFDNPIVIPPRKDDR